MRSGIGNDVTDPVFVAVVSGGGGGGGGGGAVTIADGSDAAEGARADAAATNSTGSWSVIALLKGLYGLLAGTLTTQQPVLTAGTNRSGNVTTSSGGFSVPANTGRRFLVGQNNTTGKIAFNEFGGTAIIDGANSYTVQAGQPFSVSTNQLVNFIGAVAGPVTLTEG